MPSADWTTDEPEPDQWYWIRDRWPDALHDVTLVQTFRFRETIFYKVLATFDEGVLSHLSIPSAPQAWRTDSCIARSVKPVTPPTLETPDGE